MAGLEWYPCSRLKQASSVILTKPYMCLRGDQSMALKGEITEEYEDFMSESSAILTKPYMCLRGDESMALKGEITEEYEDEAVQTEYPISLHIKTLRSFKTSAAVCQLANSSIPQPAARSN